MTVSAAAAIPIAALCIVLFFAANWVLRKKRFYKIGTIVTFIWFAPLLVLSANYTYAMYIANLGNCKPSARGPIECIVNGNDYSNLVNGSVSTGYAFAFIVLPYTVLFAMGLVIWGIIWAVRNKP